MHNAVGGLITLGVVAVGGFVIGTVRPARETVASALSQPAPLWLALMLVAAVAIPLLWCLWSVRSRLQSAKTESCQIQTERDQWKSKFEESQAVLSARPSVELHYDAYWTRRPDGSLDGPFSPQVWDTEQKLMRMHYKERIHPFDRPKPTHLRFCCLKFEKYSAIPFDFMEKNRVWSQEELAAQPPARGAQSVPHRQQRWPLL